MLIPEEQATIRETVPLDGLPAQMLLEMAFFDLTLYVIIRDEHGTAYRLT